MGRESGSNISAGFSSDSSELFSGEKPFHELDCGIFPDCEDWWMALPEGGFTFDELVETVSTCLQRVFDLESLENVIRLDFLELDPIFFNRYNANIGNPFRDRG